MALIDIKFWKTKGSLTMSICIKYVRLVFEADLGLGGKP